MLTDTDKVCSYYSSFNEWNRLSSPEGELEFRRACHILEQYLPAQSYILDLGGGPGRYSFHLAQQGHRVILADVSTELLNNARERLASIKPAIDLESIDEVNATDLSRYLDQTFDALLSFGPFYHLLTQQERQKAASEMYRVVHSRGLAFVSYIPRLSGL